MLRKRTGPHNTWITHPGRGNVFLGRAHLETISPVAWESRWNQLAVIIYNAIPWGLNQGMQAPAIRIRKELGRAVTED